MEYALATAIEDLLEQPIRGNSVNAMLHCPFHEDRTPSFSIHLDEGVWHCFSCEQSGTLNSLYRRLGEDVSFDVKMVQAKRKADSPVIYHTNFAALANSHIRRLRQEYQPETLIESFFDGRPISLAAVNHFGVGYDGDRDALSFPYGDKEGRVTGIKYRFRNGFKASEPDSQYGIFGLTNVLGASEVIICEGESDTLSAWTRGHERYGVGGTSGASVSESQWNRFSVDLIFARRVYLAYDADEAGERCAETAMRVLGDKGIRLRPTRGSDISEHLAAGGTLEELIDG